MFETVIVSANDKLVSRFLKNEIKFTDISRMLIKIINLKEFKKLRGITPVNTIQITKLANYVSLKAGASSV